MKLSEIAERIGGRIKDETWRDIEIKNIADIESADSGEITFISNPKYTAALKKTRASAVIAPGCCVRKSVFGFRENHFDFQRTAPAAG